MASLYDIGSRYAALLDRMESAEGDEALDVLDELAMMDDELEVKAENYIRIIKTKEAEADGFDKEAKRLTAKKQAAENVAKRLKQAMLDAMKMADKTELPTSIGKWKVQSNPLSCEVLDINKVPQEWHIKCDDKIDKVGLIKHYKMTGELVDGCEFKQTEGIRFK
jgi:hypothetical protein